MAKMKTLFFISVVLLLILLSAVFLIPVKPDLVSSSPDGRYVLCVYSRQAFFAMPGQGRYGSRPASVVLRNKWGWPLDNNSRYQDGEILMDSIEVEWTSNKVYYARARGFDLK